jgi:hypothetical protein
MSKCGPIAALLMLSKVPRNPEAVVEAGVHFNFHRFDKAGFGCAASARPRHFLAVCHPLDGLAGHETPHAFDGLRQALLTDGFEFELYCGIQVKVWRINGLEYVPFSQSNLPLGSGDILLPSIRVGVMLVISISPSCWICLPWSPTNHYANYAQAIVRFELQQVIVLRIAARTAERFC